jgi:hypothetical protein
MAKTLDEARGLAEIDDEFYERLVERMPDGTDVVRLRVRPFTVRGIEDQDIIMFMDVDGEFKRVVHTADGERKARFRI